MPNIERLTTLLEFMRTIPPERIDMETYYGPRFEPDDCGTTACLAGWAPFAFPDHLVCGYSRCDRWIGWKDEYERNEPSNIFNIEVLQQFFGLYMDQYNAIFSGAIPNEQAIANLESHIAMWSIDKEKT